jgi:hypothetical protein
MNWIAKKISVVAVDELLPYAGNSRTHTEEQVASLATSILEFGFTSPVLAKKSGEIIAGHARVLAAKQVGLDKVPVIYLDHLSEAQAKALVIADNKISTMAGWDYALLAKELEELSEMNFDLSKTAFSMEELEQLLSDEHSVIPVQDVEVSTHRRASRGDGVQVPKATDNDYSVFELVMLHTNKLRLVTLLNRIRKERGFDKIEDAVLVLMDSFETGTEDATKNQSND